MSKKGRSASGRTVLVSAILLAATRAAAGAPLTLTGWDARAVETARAGAVKRLEREECRKLFTDFTDIEGRTLQQNLEQWGGSPAEYIGLIPFVDGSSHPLCRKTKVAMVANPGVRQVGVQAAQYMAVYILDQITVFYPARAVLHAERDHDALPQSSSHGLAWDSPSRIASKASSSLIRSHTVRLLMRFGRGIRPSFTSSSNREGETPT
jgi:hypothetical protein